MPLPPSSEDAPLGAAPVFDLLGGAGDLRGRSLADLTGQPLAADEEATPLIRRAVAAWRTPLEALSCEQLRLLIGQDLGMGWLGLIACQLLSGRPCAHVTFYPGDLALAVLRSFDSVFRSDPAGARAVLAGDLSWIDGLRALAELDQGAAADEAVRRLETARRIAGQSG